MSRLLICGGARCGKTTLALQEGKLNGWPVHHTDDLIETHGWSGSSQEIADVWFSFTSPWIVEGTAAIRGLRKWLAQNPEGLPFDRMVWLMDPHVKLTIGQESMNKGAWSIFNEIRNEIRRRGYSI